MTGLTRSGELESGELTVSCHVRAPMLLEPVDAHVETLRTCESEGLIDDLVLRSWPEQVTTSDGEEQEVLDRFESFSQWADRAGVDIQPPFETRTRKSMVTGAETDLLVLPLICLALYDDAGGIVGVYPHSADGETYTVEDAIAKLRTGEVPVPLSETTTRLEWGEVCPECKGLLVNGQGLYACPDCAWVGTVTAGNRHDPVRSPQAGPAVEVSVAPGSSADAESPTDRPTESTADPGVQAPSRVETGSDPLSRAEAANETLSDTEDSTDDDESEAENDHSPTPTSPN